MQILILPLIWRNKEYYPVPLLVANHELLQKLITDNTKDNTGFLMWISNYCFSCIFQHNNMKTKAKSVKYYIIRFSPNGTLDIFEKMNDIDFLIQSLVDIVKNNSRVKM